MREKHTKVFIPAAALVCLGVENSSGALPCDETLQKNNMCDPYALNFIDAKEYQKQKESSAKDKKKLYNREASSSKKLTVAKSKALTTIENNSTTLSKIALANKKIVKNAKEVTLPKIQTNEKSLNKTKRNKESYTYIVSKGDTLSKIAQEFNVSIKELKELNSLDNKALIEGQKLKIPKNNKKIINTNSFYIVEAGDTLENIAKEFNTTVSKLMKYNGLSDHTIKVGQKLYLKATKVANNQRVSDFKKVLKAQKNQVGVRRLKVTATAYTSHPGQTDKTPFLAAWNNRIRPGMKIIAVSRDLIKKYGLTNGKKVRIQGLPGVYTVKDKMNKRYKKRIDIYMGVNKRKALKWGKKKLVIIF